MMRHLPTTVDPAASLTRRRVRNSIGMADADELRERADRWRQMARLIADKQAEGVLLALAERAEMKAARLESRQADEHKPSVQR